MEAWCEGRREQRSKLGGVGDHLQRHTLYEVRKVQFGDQRGILRAEGESRM